MKQPVLCWKKFQIFIVNLILLFFVTQEIRSDANPLIRKILPGDIVYDSYPQEGYFQGWNVYFENQQYNIFVTFLVSNLGPNDLNNGVSLYLSEKGGEKFFKAREFGVKSLLARKGTFFLKLNSSFMEIKDGKYVFYADAGDVRIHLMLDKKPVGTAISGGKFIVTKPDRFVRADAAVIYGKASGTLEWKGKTINLDGMGGLEHLNTNQEVYKYSKRWEIFRARSENGYRFLTGGFIGNDQFPGGFFRTISIQNESGEVVLSGKILKNEVLKEEKDPFSGYTIPMEEKLFLAENGCYLKTATIKPVGKIYLLSHVSAILRFFVRLFFAKPYQLHFEGTVSVHCPDKLPDQTFKGIHSFYLINP